MHETTSISSGLTLSSHQSMEASSHNEELRQRDFTGLGCLTRSSIPTKYLDYESSISINFPLVPCASQLLKLLSYPRSCIDLLSHPRIIGTMSHRATIRHCDRLIFSKFYFPILKSVVTPPTLFSLFPPPLQIRTAMDSSTVKQAVIKQVLAEANMANARVLIEVRAAPIVLNPQSKSKIYEEALRF